MTDTLFFERFSRRVRLSATLCCETGLRIGAGKRFDVLTSDLPVLRNAAGQPFLPGASIKGAVRSQLEAILRAVPGLKVCDPLGEGACLYRKRPGLKNQTRTAMEQAKEWRESVRKTVCAACRLFGGPGLASHVVFADALPVGEIRIERRDGVAIDRDLGRAAPGRKYDFETVPAGSRFRFQLKLNELDPAGEGAVLQGLELLQEGFALLGGFKSRGLGQVRLENHSVHILECQDKALQERAEDWETFRRNSLDEFRRFCQQPHTSEAAHA